MRGVNKVFIVGNLGSAPVVKGAVVTISVATLKQWSDKTSGQLVERTEWHRIVGFGRLGEIMATYLEKGSKVYVEGSLRTTTYQKEGVDRYATDIIANKVELLSSNGFGVVSSEPPDIDPDDLDEVPF